MWIGAAIAGVLGGVVFRASGLAALAGCFGGDEGLDPDDEEAEEGLEVDGSDAEDGGGEDPTTETEDESDDEEEEVEDTDEPADGDGLQRLVEIFDDRPMSDDHFEVEGELRDHTSRHVWKWISDESFIGLHFDDPNPEGDENEMSEEDDGATTDDGLPEELPTDPDDDFVDRTGEDVVEIETTQGGEGEPQFFFDPPFVRVDEGTTVRRVNTDGVFHTVTSRDSLDDRSDGGEEFNAQLGAEGAEFEWIADEPGRRNFYCSPHAGFMFGSIDVV